MKFNFKPSTSTVMCAVAVVCSAVLLSACGGGGGSAAADSLSLEGTAAFGAAYPVGSKVIAYDATGAVAAESTVREGGFFNLTNIASTTKMPMVIKVTVADGSEDNVETLYSTIIPIVGATASRVNVTPLTNLMVAMLSPTGNPASLLDEIKAGTATVTAATINDKKEQVKAIIATVSTAANDTTDPLTGTFTPGQAGHDKVLDAVKVVVAPTGTSSNIQVSVTGGQSDSSQPTAVNLTAGQGATTTPPALPAVTAADLPVTGISALIADLNARIQACYALPKASRTSWNGTDNGTGTGASAGITAAECKDIFKDNDPANFKSNSYTIASNGGWSGIYKKDDRYKVTWDKGAYQYAINSAASPINGAVSYIAQWKSIDTQISTDNPNGNKVVNSGADEYFALKGADGKLRLVGNQSNWDVAVEGRVDYRDFTHADFAKFSYKNVGYNIWVKNTNNISKVEVTSPSGKTLLLKPRAGYGYLGLTKSDGTVTSTSIVRMAAEFVNPSAAIGQTWTPSGGTAITVAKPSDLDPNLFWANPQWSDADIAAIPNQGNWKFDFYLTGNITATPSFTTYRRTLNRAPTIAEAKTTVWPAIVASQRDEMVANTASTGLYTFTTAGVVDLSATGNLAFWTVPTGAWSPTSAKVYGSDPANANAGFDDESTFSTGTRKTIVYCSDQDGVGTADQHCTGNQFKVGVRINTIQLNGRDSRRMQHGLTTVLRKN